MYTNTLKNWTYILTVVLIDLTAFCNGTASYTDSSRNYIILSPSLTSGTLNINYSTSQPSTANAIIHDELSNVAVVKNVLANGGVTFSDSDFISENLGYGIYDVTLEYPEGYTLETAVIYEVPVQGFQVTVDPILPVNEEVTFTYSFANGSNIEMEWQWDVTGSELEDLTGSVLLLTKGHTFTYARDYMVLVVAGNHLGRETQILNVKVQYKVYGFSVNNTSGPLPSGIPVEFILTRVTDVEPMGVVSLHIDYGDNDTFIIESLEGTTELTNMITNGSIFSHTYNTQGNFTVVITFENEISSQIFLLDQFIWDNITLMILNVPASANVSESFSLGFEFLDGSLPRTGFHYTIDFGNGTNIDSDSLFIYDLFTDQGISHIYHEIGTYTIMMYAWNGFYSTGVHYYNVTIQVPVTDLVITPALTSPAIMFPVPDGIVDFSFEMFVENPQPTNVSCYYSYGEESNSVIAGEDTVILYGTPILKTYTYQRGGIYTVNITCNNKVSRVELTTEVEMLDISGNSFTLSYPLVTAMNMTLIPPINDMFEPEILCDPRNVTFTLELSRCVKFPPGFDIEFYFGDYSSRVLIANVVIGDKVTHTYMKTGIYSVTIYVAEQNGTTVSNSFQVKLGATDLHLTRYSGILGESEFIFSISGIETSPTYMLTVSPNVEYILTSGPYSKSYIYPHYEKFYPYVVAYYSNFSETTYSKIPIRAELEMGGVNVEIPEKVDLPPGDITVNISLQSAMAAYAYVKCEFLSGDLIDRQLYSKVQNLTSQTPTIFPYKYITLGNHSAFVNCSNAVSSVVKNFTVNVWNECFQPTGMFDRDYSNYTNPLVLYTSQDRDLGSRMAVYCIEFDIDYTWSFYTKDDNETFTIPYQYTPVVVPDGRIRFARSTIHENLYKVTLNVTIVGQTWVYEPTFIQFVKPPPFASIKGNSIESVKLYRKSATLDALSVSYDTKYGPGANQNLTFEWTCREFQTFDVSTLKSYYDEATLNNNLEAQPDCMQKLIPENNDTNGIMVLDLEANPEEKGYAISVQVFVDDLNSTYMKLLQTTLGQSPDVGIVCELNCGEKYAVKQKSSFMVKCYDCEPGEIDHINFLWSLKEDGVEIPPATFKTMALTDIQSFSLSIKPDVFTPHKKYELWVAASGGWGRTSEVSSTAVLFVANLAPYNGDCSVTPTAGNATTTAFAIYCHDFLDEGWNPSRDIVRDKRDNNPLKYQYFIVNKQLNTDGTILSSTRTTISSSAEMSATELRLPLGNPQLDYNVVIEVEVYDSFGDFTTVQTSTKVTPDTSLIPTNGDDTNAVDNLFNVFDDTYAITNKGGNIMSVVRLCTATVSMYSNVNVLQQGNPITTTESNSTSSLIDVDLSMLEDSKVQILLKEKNLQIAKIVDGLIPPDEAEAPLLTADSQSMARSIETILENTDIVTSDISKIGFNSARKIMQNVRKNTDTEPYPMDNVGSVILSTSGVISAIDANLNFVIGNDREDLNVPLTLQTVEEDARSFYSYHPQKYETEVGSDEKLAEIVQMVYNQRLYKRKKQAERAEVTKETTISLFNTIETALNVTGRLVQYGEAPTEIKKNNVFLSVVKKNLETFNNMSKVQRDDVSVSTSQLAVLNGSSTLVQMHVTVFKKSPVPHARGDQDISSKVVMLSINNDTGHEIDTDKEVSLRNEGIAQFNLYNDLDTSSDMVYFTFKVKDGRDAAITYLNLPEENSPGFETTYNVYAKSGSQPSTSDFDHTHTITDDDYVQDFGFKLIIPGGVLKSGQCYIGIQTIHITNTTEPQTRRRKRSVDTNTLPVTGNFSMITITTGCRSYNEKTFTWESNGCIVLPFSTLNETVCRCPSSTRSIASTFYVAPNKIDFSTVFSKFDIANAAVYGSLIGLLVVYILAAIYLFRLDRYDRSKWNIRFLTDCDSKDKYFYLISVYTGIRPGAGTDSNVNFVLAGENGDSGVRLLSDGVQHGFQSASESQFVMSTEVRLGQLSYFRVWHDNSGTGNRSSWYLHKIIVDDPQTNQRYIFQCDRWLSLDFDDGMIERILPVTNQDDVGLDTLFAEHTRNNVAENHLWLSLIVRPKKSSFTRVQRLACGITLLLLTMITNAMFFRTADEEPVTADTLRIGVLRLSLSNLYISCIGILITTPPIFFATYVFRNAKEKDPPHNKHKQNSSSVQTKALPEKKLQSDKHLSNSIDFVIRKRKFPHWATSAAWGVLVLACTAAAFFLLLFSMEWGKDKSEEWLTTFVLSFFESLIIVDPIKVLIIAFIIAFIFKKNVDDETILIDMRKLREAASTLSTNNNREFALWRHQVLSKCGPPPAERLEEQRKLRTHERKAKQVFQEVLLYIVFAIIVYCISYVNRDDRSYQMKTNVDHLIYDSNKYHLGFSKVSSVEILMDWMETTFVPAFYPVENYNGISLGLQDKFYVNDLSNIRLGLVRLRQVRMPKKRCDVPFLTPYHFCVSAYDSDKEENRDFCLHWKIKNSSCPGAHLTEGAYTYKSSGELHGIHFAGEYDLYGGGGYVQDLPNNRDLVNDILDEIKTNKWLDRKTRSLFIEFSLYNPNVNLIAYGTFVLELTDTGTLVTYTYTQSFRPSLLTDATGAFSLLCYSIYLLVIIVASVKVVKKLRQQKWSYFKVAWNIVDTITILLSYTGVGVWAIKYIHTMSALKRYYNDKSGFISFTEIVTWDTVFNSILGGLSFTSTLRILKALGYNKRMSELVVVIRHAAAELLSFSVLFILAFIGFAMLGYLLFGYQMFDYRNMLTACGSLANTLIGRNSLDKLVNMAPIFAQIYFICYVIFVIFVLLTMFAAILNQSISAVREDINKSGAPIGILDLLKGTITDILGMFGIHLRKAKRQSGAPNKNKIGKTASTGSIDTTNVLQLVRETFGSLEEMKKEPEEETVLSPKEKKVRIKDARKYMISRQASDMSEPRSLSDISARVVSPSIIQRDYSSYL